jgi:hypothetical protein
VFYLSLLVPILVSGPLFHAFAGKEPDYRLSGHKHTVLPWSSASPGIEQAKGFLEYQCGLFGGMTQDMDGVDNEGMAVDQTAGKFSIESICSVGSDQSGKCKISQYYDSSTTAPLVLMCLGSQIVVNVAFVPEKTLDCKRQVTPVATGRESAKFTMVHGDVLMLFGKQFELHLERSGCCILLVASSSTS